MKTFTNLLSLLGAFLALAIAFFTVTGDIQNHIKFESVKSEMGFTIMAIFIAMILVASVITPEKNTK